MNTALLVIDMQKDFFQDGELLAERNQLVKNINSTIKNARTKKVPIIWIRQEFEPDLSDAFLVMRDRKISKTIKGTSGAEILNDLDRHESDYLVIKKRFSAFYKTKLEELLAELGVNELILTGINTHACIRMAAIDAYQRDFRVNILEDCVYSWDKEHHDVSLKYLGRDISKVMNSKDLSL